jgi:hypothetical protein
MGGTHRKIYNWVETPNQIFSCSDEKERDYVQLLKIFPVDVKWRNIKSNSKTDSALGEIIY